MSNPVTVIYVVNFLLNFALLSSLIFIPIFGAQLGASDFQVGLIGAAYGGAYLVSSLYSGRVSDRQGRLWFVRTGLFLCLIAFGLQLLANHLITLIAVRAIVGFAQGVAMAALVAYAFEAGADMGKFSSYGSLGWIGGAALAALSGNIDVLFLSSVLCSALAWGATMFLPKETIKKFPLAEKPPLTYFGVVQQGFRVYLTIFLRHLGATSVWIILPLYFVSLGYDNSWVGIFWAINFSVQFFVMRYLDRFNPYRIFNFGQFLSASVFLAYIFAHDIVPLIIVQILLGLAWSCLYVGALLIVLKLGEDRGTASGIFQATLSLCGALGPFLGGVVASFAGYTGVLAMAAALGFIGIIIGAPQPASASTALVTTEQNQDSSLRSE